MLQELLSEKVQAAQEGQTCESHYNYGSWSLLINII